MHAIGILHKDIKADNVLIRDQNVVSTNISRNGTIASDLNVCLTDLGFSSHYYHSNTNSVDRSVFNEDTCGTPGYIDPAVL